MGHKVHPYGFRLGVSRTWTAKWYADKDYTDLLKEDIAIRLLVTKRLANASVSGVEIERGIKPRDGHDPHRQAGHRDRQGRGQRRAASSAGRRADQAQGQSSRSRRSASRSSMLTWSPPTSASNWPAALPSRRP